MTNSGSHTCEIDGHELLMHGNWSCLCNWYVIQEVQLCPEGSFRIFADGCQRMQLIKGHIRWALKHKNSQQKSAYTMFIIITSLIRWDSKCPQCLQHICLWDSSGACVALAFITSSIKICKCSQMREHIVGLLGPLELNGVAQDLVLSLWL